MKEERPDHDLLRDVAAGSKAALGALYARHAARILGFLKRLLGDAGSAEDIVHDVFLEVWRSAARFQGRSSVSTWMLSIARNKAIDELRKKKPDGNLDDREAGSTPEQDLMELSGGRYLRSMVDRLSHEHREIIYLVYYNEKSISEISEILSIPENTVKTRMFYARKRLRELLEARSGKVGVADFDG